MGLFLCLSSVAISDGFSHPMVKDQGGSTRCKLRKATYPKSLKASLEDVGLDLSRLSSTL